jgi:hypothetical protein
MHQEIHFFGGPLPVLHTERIKCKVFNPKPDTILGYFHDRFGALFMTPQSRKVLVGGPPAVAVHDYRYMTGNLLLADTKSLCSGPTFFFKALRQDLTPE